MKSFDELLEKWDWREMRNCPGRYVLKGGLSRQPPEDIFEIETKSFRFSVDTAPDEVLVTELKGGLISFRKTEGTYVHTLCDDTGFARKLKDLGIFSGLSPNK